MARFKLESCDIILFINDRNDPMAKFSRWAIGPYEHVAMYLGQAFSGVPFVYESRGRGVSVSSLLPQTGRPALVMRPFLNECAKLKLIGEGLRIAADEKSFYDYLTIVYSCVPRVLKEKFPWLPLPVKYHRDVFMICSEAVAEVFWRLDIDVLPRDIVPLPIDFVLSPVLRPMHKGILLEDILP